MPSYRVTMTIGMLRPGSSPEQVQPTAADAAAEIAVLESSTVDVTRGEARLVVRFTADDPELALQVARHVVASTDRVAHITYSTVTERDGGTWRRVG
ncbi:hypothetical protein ELQ90_00525 [Labedella phragmitis]|uniref:Uncharacterized protein n=1 Tax=Labedella phragmitis TaxID=2498849 RepID=A0A3S3ZCG8_9MICO|nr:hypothetical protein [Labedella phragmitis]RWZ52480.1 hypothetical protein ELQ90_00525 [Labedella phragmitis]